MSSECPTLCILNVGGIWKRAGVFLAAKFFDLIEDRAKNIGLVVGNGAGKIGEIFRALNDCGHALETHAGIDVTLRKGENVPSALALN